MRRVHVLAFSCDCKKLEFHSFSLLMSSSPALATLYSLILSFPYLRLEFRTRTHNKILSFFPRRSLSPSVSLLSIAFQRILCQRAYDKILPLPPSVRLFFRAAHLDERAPTALREESRDRRRDCCALLIPARRRRHRDQCRASARGHCTFSDARGPAASSPRAD